MSRITTEKGMQNALHDIMHHPNEKRCCWKMQDAFTQGVPDQLYCVQGLVSWVELKYVPVDKINEKGLCDPKIRPAQYARAREWHACGGFAYFLIGVDDTMYVFDPVQVPQPKERVDRPTLRARSIWEAGLDRPNLRRFGRQFLGLPATGQNGPVDVSGIADRYRLADRG